MRPGAETAWRNRIVRTGERPAIEFLANPSNWRLHSRAQRVALDAVLGTVGWVTGVIVNARSGYVIDGHARIEEALKRGDDTPVPFIEVDLSDEEEKIILSTLDPLSAMAEASREKLDALLHDLPQIDPEVSAMLTDVAKSIGLEYDGSGEMQALKKNAPDEIPAQWIVLIECANEQEQNILLQRFIDEGLQCKALNS